MRGEWKGRGNRNFKDVIFNMAKTIRRYNMLRKTILMGIIFLSIAYYALGEETKRPDTECKGKLKEERFSALGFEIGMCKWEAEEILKRKDEQLKLKKQPTDYPENLENFTVSYKGVIPPVEGLSEPLSVYHLYFRNNVLYFIGGNYIYKSISEAKSAFDTLNNTLTNKYGQGTEESPYSKKWIAGETRITLEVFGGSTQVLNVLYADIEQFNLAQKEIEEYKRLRKSGEGF